MTAYIRCVCRNHEYVKKFVVKVPEEINQKFIDGTADLDNVGYTTCPFCHKRESLGNTGDGDVSSIGRWKMGNWEELA